MLDVGFPRFQVSLAYKTLKISIFLHKQSFRFWVGSFNLTPMPDAYGATLASSAVELQCNVYWGKADVCAGDSGRAGGGEGVGGGGGGG